jgi:hypothetical protein
VTVLDPVAVPPVHVPETLAGATLALGSLEASALFELAQPDRMVTSAPRTISVTFLIMGISSVVVHRQSHRKANRNRCCTEGGA